MLFGFFQFPAWPTLMTITSQHFDIKSEGKALGVWSANGDFGNILGFAISGIIVDTLSLRWEIAMLIAAAINWSLALSVYFLVDDNYHRESTSLV
jgi:sugar phosphate permease